MRRVSHFGEGFAGGVAQPAICFEREYFVGLSGEEAPKSCSGARRLGASQIPWVRRTSAMRQSALFSLISSSMPVMARLLGIRLPLGRRRE
jgi:hypothetical protein